MTIAVHIISFCVSFLSRVLMNSINWPAPSIWVFIAQLGEHCSANAEATDSNPVEAPKIFFSGYFRNCLNCNSLRWSHTPISFVDLLIKSFNTHVQSYLRDTIDFLKYLPEIVPENTILASFDVTNLYTNITHELGAFH